MCVHVRKAWIPRHYPFKLLATPPPPCACSMNLTASCSSSVGNKGGTLSFHAEMVYSRKNYLLEMLKDSLKCSLSNKRKVPLTRGLKSLEETWFQVKNNLSVAKLRLFLTIKGVKPSNTHQKARVSPSTSVQL